MSVVLTSTPRKTMEVLGGESLSGEVLSPRECKRSAKASKAATDWSALSAPQNRRCILCTRSRDSDT